MRNTAPVGPARAVGPRTESTTAIADELLAGLAFSPHPTARVLQEQVRARMWRPKDRIEPDPIIQHGATHILHEPLIAPPRVVAAANPRVIHNQRAGGVYSGTWTTVGGVADPTVTRQATPPGTNGTWNSSSWVGLDGTFGSTDVLQAGVQQSIDAAGNARYVAWFEWYAPPQPGDPDYVYQANIPPGHPPGRAILPLMAFIETPQ